MITEPRIDKTLAAIRNQLAQVVAPSVSDPIGGDDAAVLDLAAW